MKLAVSGAASQQTSAVTSNMNFRGLVQQRSLDSCTRKGSFRVKTLPWRCRSLTNDQHQRTQETTPGVSPRGNKQVTKTLSNSLVDYSDPHRMTIILEKEDNEAFGFEVQTYGLQLRNSSVVEMCTFVCSVQLGSVAENAGLTAGDIIVTVNGVSIEGSTHKDVIDLIRISTNLLKMETVSGSVVRRIELEKRRHVLKQTLREKWVELQSLNQKEGRLTRGNLNDLCLYPSMDSLMSVSSPTGRAGQRFSSDSSCRSAITDDSEDGSSMFDDSSLFSFLPEEALKKDRRRSLPRTRSISLASSSDSLSPTCESAMASSVFGTLPRRSRRGSVRKHILRFFPGLQHSVEEEESP